MKIYQFHIKIEQGNIVFKSENHKEMFKRWLAQWNDKEVSLEVTEKKSTRSGQQNRYYWLYLTLIENETGNKVEDLHNYFRGKFLTKKISEMYGDKFRITKSTTELSKGEFCEYLIDISGLTGIELPDTTEYFGYSYHK
jgi:hypothetical protein